jgi:hypothetical protein
VGATDRRCTRLKRKMSGVGEPPDISTLRHQKLFLLIIHGHLPINATGCIITTKKAQRDSCLHQVASRHSLMWLSNESKQTNKDGVAVDEGAQKGTMEWRRRRSRRSRGRLWPPSNSNEEVLSSHSLLDGSMLVLMLVFCIIHGC